MIQRKIPKSGEELPVIGLGTWQAFDVGPSESPRLGAVLDVFAAAGGRVIDTSPMYGGAEEAVGALRSHVANPFLATKVWTRGAEHGIAQMKRSLALLRTDRVDLMQIHNLVDWRRHLATLRRWKDEGRVRYAGITHYAPSAFGELESIMKSEELDFVQLPLSIGAPEAEEKLLPLAEEREIAVLVNRPFEGGSLFRHVRGTPVPDWVRELGSESWSDLFLRWIISHPAVTCVIPATGNPEHMRENVRAGEGKLLSMRERRQVGEKLGYPPVSSRK
jgi:diketogulonate reductase-like aldo/keto reductase